MRLLILGAGPMGRSVAEAARASGVYAEILFMDNELEGPDIQCKCGAFSLYADGLTDMIAAMENETEQAEWVERLKDMLVPLATVVHPTARVADSARLEPGSAVLDGAALEENAVLPKGSILCAGARLTATDSTPECSLIRG